MINLNNYIMCPYTQTNIRNGAKNFGKVNNNNNKTVELWFY